MFLRPIRLLVIAIATTLSPAVWAIGVEQAGAISPQTLKLPSGPNSVRGLSDAAEIDAFSAQIKYRVPIELPGAVRGFRPTLDLVYSGDLGNGPLGIGWTIGAPQIRRSLRLGVPSYSDNDEIELVGIGSGGRLVPIGIGQWRIEGKGHAFKVEAQANGGYKVTDSSGVQYFFGSANASRHYADTRVQAWLLDSVIDLAGQTIQLAYTRDQNELYLQTMTWGPSQNYTATLTYGPRPDAVLSYRRGYRVVTAQRLSSLTIESAGLKRSSYQLAYDDSFPLSRLHSVTLFGSDGLTALPTLGFSYGASEAPTSFTLPGAAGWLLGQGVSFLDVDGDGVEDLVRLDSGINQWRRNLCGSFDTAQSLTGVNNIDLNKSRLMDVYGTARPELVVNNVNSWTVYTLSGNNWVTQGTYPGTVDLPLISPSTTALDLNGDGRTDMLASRAGGIVIEMNSANGFIATNAPAIGGDPTVTPEATGVRFFDINGDGLDDVVQVQAESMRWFIGHGDGTFDAPTVVPYPWSDSLVDLSTVRLADLNRDGLMDLLRIASGNVQWYRGLPNGRFSPVQTVARPEPTDANVVVAVVDANGNGSQDLVWSSPNGMWALDIAGSTSAGMLVAIDNGMGKVTNFGYGASAQLAATARAAGAPWVRLLPISIPVPVRTEIDLADGEPARVVDVTVRDGFWDYNERRFGGFQTALRHFPDAGGGERWEVTTYHLGLGANRVLRGMPLTVNTYAGALLTANLVTSEVNTYQALAIDGMPDLPLVKLPVKTRTRVSHVEHVPTPIVSETDYVYDSAGHLVRENRLGRLDLLGDEQTIVKAYASDDTLWVRDLVIEEQVLDGGGNLLSDRRSYFGDDNAELPFGQVGKGWLRRVDELLKAFAAGETDRWVTTSSTTYDAVGNPQTTIKNGVQRTFTYDSNALHPVSETVHPAPGQSLVWGMTWDNVLDVPATFTDPNGVVSQIGYDPLGRVTSIAHAGAPAHIVYKYDWTAPRPRTYTYEFDGAPENLTAFSGTWAAGSGWREELTQTNGAAETLFKATHLDANRWIVSAWLGRDGRGRIVGVADSFYSPSIDGLTAPPSGTSVQTRSYDGLDRITAQTLPTGGQRTRSYAAFSEVETTTDLAPILRRSDGLDRVTHTERTVNGIVEQIDASYDAQSRVVAYALQGGRVKHQFAYDTMGRLRSGNDPDAGPRSYGYDDGSRLVSQTNATGQTVNIDYDGVGRALHSIASTGQTYVYHYDVPRLSSAVGTAGRLAWVEEPTGGVDFSYDTFGRQSWMRRTINGQSAERTVQLSPSGLVLSLASDDGFRISMTYDDAGRATQVGDMWQAAQVDAAGRILEEHFGNSVRQLYDRDSLGDTKRIQILPANGSALYDVTLARSLMGVLNSISDTDGVGLDHSASFGFDSAQRLTTAQLGAASNAFSFSYAYDELQNMTSRLSSGRATTSMLAGSYLYGENGAGPRQLTSVIAPDHSVIAFGYDAAGRQIRDGDLTLAYDSFDRLTGATRAGLAVASYGYGYEGQRIFAKAADGSTQLWYTEDIAERGGAREHYVRIAGRTLARVDLPLVVSAASVKAAGVPVSAGFGAVLLLMCLLVRVCFIAEQRRRWLRITTMLALLGMVHSCAGPQSSAVRQKVSTSASMLYFHNGVSAGPMMFTRSDGSVAEERRFEPFGAPLEAARTNTMSSPVDFTLDPTNELNKETDPATGFSYHGARWLDPRIARWTEPDPPTKAPDPKFTSAPWTLNPYQYVSQNPVQFWDPDGRDQAQVEESATIVKKAGEVNTVGGVKIEVGKAEAKASAGSKGLTVGGKVTTLAADKVWQPTPDVKLGVGGTMGELSGKAGVDADGLGAGAKASLVSGNVSAEVKDVAKVKVEVGVEATLKLRVGTTKLAGGLGPVSVSIDLTPWMQAHPGSAVPSPSTARGSSAGGDTQPENPVTPEAPAPATPTTPATPATPATPSSQPSS